MNWIRVIALALVWGQLADLGAAQAKPSSRLKTAMHAVSVARYPEALFYLSKLSKKLQASPAAQRLHLRAWLETGALDKVLDRAPPYLSSAPADHEVRLWLVRAAVDSGAAAADHPGQAEARFELAVQEASRIPEGDPSYGMALRWQASALISLGRPKEAEALVSGALAKSPEKVAVHLASAQVTEWLEGTGAAVAVLHASEAALKDKVRTGPDNDFASLLLARAQTHLRARQIREAQRAMEAAFKLGFQSRNTARDAGEQIWWVAAKFRADEDTDLLLKVWLEHHPDEAIAHFWKGYVTELRGQLEQAIPHFEKAWVLSQQTHAESALRLALLLGKSGKVKRGLEMMDHALRLNAPVRAGTLHPADALIALAVVAVAQKDAKQAVAALEVGAKWLPLRWKLQQNLGFVRREYGGFLFAQKKRSAAKRQWKKSAANYELAAHVVRQGELEPRVIAQVLNDTGLMYHYHLNRLKDAERLYLEALEHDPNYIDTLENLGVLMVKRKKWALAMSWFDKALAIDANRALSKQLRAEYEARLRRRK